MGSIEFPDRTAAWDCRHIFVRERFLRFLPGEKRRLTIIVPGDSVRELAVSEIMEGGNVHGKSEVTA